MTFSKHVFISYAHLDNEDVGDETGWVTRLHERLASILAQRLGRRPEIWRDEKLTGNDVFGDEILRQLPEAAVLLSVVSPRYVESEWCLREAGTFCDVAKAPPGLVVDNKSRLFKIVKSPPASEASLPAAMRDTLGFEFYTRLTKKNAESHDKDDPVFELDPCYGEDLGRRFNTAVARLAWDIAQTLKRLEGGAAATGAAGAAAQASEAPRRPTVYLAECSWDRKQDLATLRAELATAGHPILPDRLLPQDETGCRARVAEDLERSALSIHLVGAQYGMVPDGPSQVSVVALQNELAAARARGGSLRRVIWLPSGTQPRDAAQGAFIEKLLRDPDAQFGAELITTDLEAVKAAVRAALEPIAAPKEPLAQGEAGAPVLYVIFDPRDREATVPLRRHLAARGITVEKPVFEGDAAEVRTANQERLSRCDAVLVFHGSGTEAWKASVDSEVRKAAALREGRPLRATFTWLAEPRTEAKADAIDMAQANLIDGLGGFSEALTAPVVDLLLGGRGRG